MQNVYPLVATLAAYLIGSVSFAVVVSRAMGLKDPRTYGSHNPGATNVLRSGNRVAAVVTLVLDALKGFVPVLLVQVRGDRFGLGEGTVALVALAAFLGHLWPLFFRFQGGKGVATAAGIVFGLSWQLGLALLVVWVLIAIAFRISSLASIVAAIVTPPLGFYFLGNWPEAWVLIPITLLLLWRHRANIRKLVAGTESKIGA